MIPRDDIVRIIHMYDAAQEALEYAQGCCRDDLGKNTMLVRALVKCIEIVGEAAAQTKQETRNQFCTIPWGEIIGMRNWLIHAYFDIDLDHVWATITDDLPPLIDELKVILANNQTDIGPEFPR